MRRSGAFAFVIAAIACALSWSSAPAARAATPTADEARSLGKQAYDYGLPLLEFSRVRHEQTGVRCPG